MSNLITELPAFIVEARAKVGGGWYFIIAGADGDNYPRIHTFDDPRSWVSKTRVYRITYEERMINGRVPYKVLIGQPEKLVDCSSERHLVEQAQFNRYLKDWRADWAGWRAGGSERLQKLLWTTRDAYLASPTRWKAYDKEDAWLRAAALKQDIRHFGPAAGQWVQTAKAQEEDPDTEIPEVGDLMNQVSRKYRTKPEHLTTKGDLRPSQLSRILGASGDTDYTDIKVKMNVDSQALQVALRERHYAEIFLYFALCAWLRRHRKFPQFTVTQVLQWISDTLTGRAKRCPRAVLKRLITAGLVRAPKRISHANQLADTMRLSIVSQSQYVEKHEAAWVAKQRAVNGLNRGGRKVLNRLIDKKNYKYQRIEHVDKDGKRLDFETQKLVDAAIRPYFDIWANKTTTLDLGFSQLVNSGLVVQRAWLYEAVTSSWDRPVCRTRIMQNILLTRDQQQDYEKKSKTMWKMHNFMEIPQDMLNRLTAPARQTIDMLARRGGKFWIGKSGTYYRQEGNSFKSDRFKWRTSGGAARCRLSPSQVRPWWAVRPVFQAQIISAQETQVVDDARFLPIDRLKPDGRPVKTSATRKAHLKTCEYFNVRREAVACPSTDPRSWREFEPLLQLDKRNGDVLVPLARSLGAEITDRPHIQRQTWEDWAAYGQEFPTCPVKKRLPLNLLPFIPRDLAWPPGRGL